MSIFALKYLNKMKRLCFLIIVILLSVVSVVSAQTSDSKRPPRPTTQTTTNKPTTTATTSKPVAQKPTVTQSKPQQSTQTRSSGSTNTFTVNGVSFTMVYVQGGTFTMGAHENQALEAFDNEKPTHSVTVSSFSIGQTEVTQALWKAVMGTNPSSFKGDNLPVEHVSWNDCQEFVRKLNSLTGKNFRLPTEAEWEFAARGGNKSKDFRYSGSNKINEVAWHFDSQTHPVKMKKPNELGLYDMSGNVWEWCQDWYGDYKNSIQINPIGPSTGEGRVFRGGSWYNDPGCCRTSDRDGYWPDESTPLLGLRLALSE